MEIVLRAKRCLVDKISTVVGVEAAERAVELCVYAACLPRIVVNAPIDYLAEKSTESIADRNERDKTKSRVKKILCETDGFSVSPLFYWRKFSDSSYAHYESTIHHEVVWLELCQFNPAYDPTKPYAPFTVPPLSL